MDDLGHGHALHVTGDFGRCYILGALAWHSWRGNLENTAFGGPVGGLVGRIVVGVSLDLVFCVSRSCAGLFFPDEQVEQTT